VLVTLISAKGSPGVTTTAAALTAVVADGDERLLVEIDPSGGDIEALTGVTGEPGLLRVANDLRRHVDPQVLPGYAIAAPPGVRAILAPTSGPAAGSVVASVADRLGAGFASIETDVLGDGGRWAPTQVSARRIGGADLVAVVCRPTVASVEHTRHILDRVREIARPIAIVLVGDRPYGADEVAEALETPVAGIMAWDPGAVGALWAEGVTRRWHKSWLARSARDVFAGLLDLASVDTVAVR